MTTLTERDLRSLERPGLYRIFKPLDPEEPLPRELLLAARRQRTVGRRELAGALWLPAFAALLVLAGWVNISGPIVLGFVALLLAGFVAFAVSGDRKSPLK